MRGERFFVAVATTIFVLYGMPASAQDGKAIIQMAHPGFRGDEAILGGCATRGCVEMTRLRLLSCSAFTWFHMALD